MIKHSYSVALRHGLSLDGEVITSIGISESKDDAVKLAFKFINDKANLKMLGCESFYCRQIMWNDDDAIGIDYGSHSRFVIIKPEAF